MWARGCWRSRRASRLQRCPWCLRTQTTQGAQSEALWGLQPDCLGEASPLQAMDASYRICKAIRMGTLAIGLSPL